MKFNSEQINLLQKIVPGIDFGNKLSEDILMEIDDKVSDYFALHGLGDKNQVNDTGRICESIMDVLAN